jgi:hypothetical protein
MPNISKAQIEQAIYFLRTNPRELASAEVAEKSTLIEVIQGLLDQPEGEPVAWEAEYGVGLIKYITDAQYKKFTLSIRRHYRPFKCLLCKTHPAPFTPITSDDVTDDMLDTYIADINQHRLMDVKIDVAAAYNAVNAWGVEK